MGSSVASGMRNKKDRSQYVSGVGRTAGCIEPRSAQAQQVWEQMCAADRCCSLLW